MISFKHSPSAIAITDSFRSPLWVPSRTDASGNRQKLLFDKVSLALRQRYLRITRAVALWFGLVDSEKQFSRVGFSGKRRVAVRLTAPAPPVPVERWHSQFALVLQYTPASFGALDTCATHTQPLPRRIVCRPKAWGPRRNTVPPRYVSSLLLPPPLSYTADSISHRIPFVGTMLTRYLRLSPRCSTPLARYLRLPCFVWSLCTCSRGARHGQYQTFHKTRLEIPVVVMMIFHGHGVMWDSQLVTAQAFSS